MGELPDDEVAALAGGALYDRLVAAVAGLEGGPGTLTFIARQIDDTGISVEGLSAELGVLVSNKGMTKAEEMKKVLQLEGELKKSSRPSRRKSRRREGPEFGARGLSSM